jgi:hypothetical protein
MSHLHRFFIAFFFFNNARVLLKSWKAVVFGPCRGKFVPLSISDRESHSCLKSVDKWDNQSLVKIYVLLLSSELIVWIPYPLITTRLPNVIEATWGVPAFPQSELQYARFQLASIYDVSTFTASCIREWNFDSRSRHLKPPCKLCRCILYKVYLGSNLPYFSLETFLVFYHNCKETKQFACCEIVIHCLEYITPLYLFETLNRTLTFPRYCFKTVSERYK